MFPRSRLRMSSSFSFLDDIEEEIIAHVHKLTFSGPLTFQVCLTAYSGGYCFPDYDELLHPNCGDYALINNRSNMLYLEQEARFSFILYYLRTALSSDGNLGSKLRVAEMEDHVFQALHMLHVYKERKWNHQCLHSDPSSVDTS